MPLGVEDVFSGLCEASQTTTAETFIRESNDMLAAKVMCIDSREILHTCEGAHERMYSIDTSIWLYPEKRLF